MKTLLIALLAICSISSFATEVLCNYNITTAKGHIIYDELNLYAFSTEQRIYTDIDPTVDLLSRSGQKLACDKCAKAVKKEKNSFVGMKAGYYLHGDVGYTTEEKDFLNASLSIKVEFGGSWPAFCTHIDSISSN